jgi:hypothetical protein
MTVYRTGTTKRRTKAETAQLEQQILDVLAANKQSVRHTFYRMTNIKLPIFVEKSEAGYRQVQHLTTKMRRDGRLPYGQLTDSSRRGYFVPTYRNAGEFVRSVKSLYRADLWKDSDYYCEVWCESRSIAGVIQEDCEELAVSLFPAGGLSSGQWKPRHCLRKSCGGCCGSPYRLREESGARARAILTKLEREKVIL